jgi:16S rRNA (adenine1518-N6/adenine1519-N6)-dimethyltransferase
VALLEAGADVWAIERDRTLFEHLSATLQERFPQTFHLLEGDAVDRPLAGLPDPLAPGCKIVANLPYAISTPWMDAVLSGPLPARMVLMLQREAADRYTAAAGSRSFGAISIFLQAAFDTAPGHRVSGACFHPRPDVDSTLLHLVRKPQPHAFLAEHKLLIRSCFQQRRKQIGAVIRARRPDLEAVWRELLAAAGFSLKVRAEAIPVPVWIQLVSGLTGPA